MMESNMPGASPPLPDSAVGRIAVAMKESRSSADVLTVGPYRLVESIGTGGMGVVYRAEQAHPIRRTVALKLIKPGMDSREIIARFQSERQALAMMSHRNVAKVLDAGTSDDGRPYFVMEHVPGKSITHYCDEHRYTLKQRLELFIQACEAVQHAHQKAILHRDLKPSNILVAVDNGDAEVKVIDFGVAKALSQPLTDRTLATESGQLIGTPEYMSPEQAGSDGQDVDTRSDIYSLGVVLYELLTGALPFDPKTLRSSGVAEIRRIIREVDPPRPSTRLSTLGEGASEIASNRGTRIESLNRELRGEIEWIPLKAMRKEPDRRYASVQELADDLRNYLESKPLLAGPESRIYRTKKFLHRNRSGVVVSATVALLFTAGAAFYISSIGAEQARTLAALAEATRNQATAQAVSSFLIDDVLAKAGPEDLQDDAVQQAIMKIMLEPAAASIDERFRDQPEAAAAVRHMLAMVFLSLGKADLGLIHAETALAQRRQLLGDDHPDTLHSMSALSLVLHEQGRLADAEETCREALARRQRVLGDTHLDTFVSVNNLAQLLQDQGHLDESERFLREGLKSMRDVLGEDHHQTMTSMNNLGWLHILQGRFSDAERILREVMTRQQRILGPDHRSTLFSMNNLCVVLIRQGKLSEAEPFMIEILERRRRVLGENHPETLTSKSGIASLLSRQGRFEEAERLYRELHDRRRQLRGDNHPETLDALSALAQFLTNMKRYEDAEPVLREVLERRREVLGDAHLYTLRSMNHLGKVLEAQQRHEEAEFLFREVLEKGRNLLHPHHRTTIAAANNVASALARRGELAEAEDFFRQALDSLRQIDLAEPSPDLGVVLHHLAEVLRRRRALANARELAEEAVQLYDRHIDWSESERKHALEVLGSICWDQNDWPAAAMVDRKLLQHMRRISPDDNREISKLLGNLTMALLRSNEYAAAEEAAGDYLAVQQSIALDDWQTFNAESLLGASLLGQDRYEQAEPLILSGYAGMRRHHGPGEATWPLEEAISRLVQLYDATERPDEAARWRHELQSLRASTQPSTPPTTAPSAF